MKCIKGCDQAVDLDDEKWQEVVAEHNLTDPQALVAGNLCPDHLAEFLAWLQDSVGESPLQP